MDSAVAAEAGTLASDAAASLAANAAHALRFLALKGSVKGSESGLDFAGLNGGQSGGGVDGGGAGTGGAGDGSGGTMMMPRMSEAEALREITRRRRKTAPCSSPTWEPSPSATWW